MKNILSLEDYIIESENFKKDADFLIKDLDAIDDVKYEVIDDIKRKIKIKTNDISFAKDLLDTILYDKGKYTVKSASIENSNDIIVTFMTPKEVEKEKADIEKRKAEKKASQDAMMGIVPADAGAKDTGVPAA